MLFPDFHDFDYTQYQHLCKWTLLHIYDYAFSPNHQKSKNKEKYIFEAFYKFFLEVIIPIFSL